MPLEPPKFIDLNNIDPKLSRKLAYFFYDAYQKGFGAWQKLVTYHFRDGQPFILRQGVFITERKAGKQSSDFFSNYRFQVEGQNDLGHGTFAVTFNVPGTLAFTQSGATRYKTQGKDGAGRLYKRQYYDRYAARTAIIEHEYRMAAPHLHMKPPLFLRDHERKNFLVSLTVMDKFEEKTLHQVLDEHYRNIRPLSPRELVELHMALLKSLQAQASGPGTMHLDVKPENIIINLGPPIQAKFVDYAFAKPSFCFFKRLKGNSPPSIQALKKAKSNLYLLTKKGELFYFDFLNLSLAPVKISKEALKYLPASGKLNRQQWLELEALTGFRPTYSVEGTREYIAPELMKPQPGLDRQGQVFRSTVTLKADVFSLGRILALLWGALQSAQVKIERTENPEALMRGLFEQPAGAYAAFSEGFKRKLKGLILHMLELNPANRCPIAEAIADFTEFQEGFFSVQGESIPLSAFLSPQGEAKPHHFPEENKEEKAGDEAERKKYKPADLSELDPFYFPDSPLKNVDLIKSMTNYKDCLSKKHQHYQAQWFACFFSHKTRRYQKEFDAIKAFMEEYRAFLRQKQAIELSPLYTEQQKNTKIQENSIVFQHKSLLPFVHNLTKPTLFMHLKKDMALSMAIIIGACLGAAIGFGLGACLGGAGSLFVGSVSAYLSASVCMAIGSLLCAQVGLQTIRPDKAMRPEGQAFVSAVYANLNAPSGA